MNNTLRISFIVRHTTMLKYHKIQLTIAGYGTKFCFCTKRVNPFLSTWNHKSGRGGSPCIYNVCLRFTPFSELTSLKVR